MMHLWQGQDASLERAAELYLLDTVAEKDLVSSCDLPGEFLNLIFLVEKSRSWHFLDDDWIWTRRPRGRSWKP